MYRFLAFTQRTLTALLLIAEVKESYWIHCLLSLAILKVSSSFAENSCFHYPNQTYKWLKIPSYSYSRIINETNSKYSSSTSFDRFKIVLHFKREVRKIQKFNLPLIILQLLILLFTLSARIRGLSPSQAFNRFSLHVWFNIKRDSFNFPLHFLVWFSWKCSFC